MSLCKLCCQSMLKGTGALTTCHCLLSASPLLPQKTKTFIFTSESHIPRLYRAFVSCYMILVHKHNHNHTFASTVDPSYLAAWIIWTACTYNYSGTPPYRHPWNAAIYIVYDNADTLLGPECYLHRLTYIQNPWNVDTPLFHKVDAWLGPNSITAHTNSLSQRTLW